MVAMAGMVVGGCETIDLKGGRTGDGVAADRWPFAPVSMRVSPFTSVRALEGDGGAELDLKVELLDQVGDPTKGVGEFRFELYAAGPNVELSPRSPLYSWRASIATIKQNQAHYNATLRTYEFRLAMRSVPEGQTPLRVFAQYTPRRGDRITAEAMIESE